MGAQTKPFLKLAEEITYFVRATEVRVLNVVTSIEDREVVVAQLGLAEGHGYNHSPFFTIEDAHSAESDGWAGRAERMRSLYEERREGMAKEGISLPALPRPSHAEQPGGTFGRVCAHILDAVTKATPLLQGLVVVLAPTEMARATAFEQVLRDIIAIPALEALRFIVTDLDTSSVPSLVKEHGEERARDTTCLEDRDAVRAEQQRRIARAAAAPVDAPLQAQMGFAAPDVAPPPRPGKPTGTALPKELAALLGPSAALYGEAGAEVRRNVYAAANALQTKRGDDAVRHQRAAADTCFALGLEREGSILELVLAAYLLQLQQAKAAREVYARVGKRAEASDGALAARAYLGLGAALAVEREAEATTTAYARAGELAQAGGEPLLAIEAYRLAGQVAFEATATQLAMSMWQRALGIAEGIPPESIAVSSAAATARALAAACERRGLREQARSLLAQADRFEAATNDPGPSE